MNKLLENINFCLPHQIGRNPQQLCGHQQFFTDVEFIKCCECSHSFDVQLLLLSLPPTLSISLTEIWMTLYPDSNILCRIILNIPDNPPSALILTFPEFQMLFRLFALAVGTFCHIVYEDQSVVEVCTNTEEPVNQMLLTNFNDIFGKIVLEKTSQLKTMSLIESDTEKRDYMKNILEMASTFFSNFHKETLRKNSNPIKYIRETLMISLQVIRGQLYQKETLTVGPNRSTFDLFEIFVDTFNQIRRTLGTEIFKIDITLSTIPVL